MRLGKEKLGITFRTFGAPYNATDATTVQVLEANPDMRVWLFPQTRETSLLPLPRIGEMNIERGTGIVKYAPFAANYPAHADEPVLVLQCHPVNWDERSWNDFKKIIALLKKEGATFTTPTDYFGIDSSGAERPSDSNP
jgi:peptidoglycan/xylan/chitin deacetylase (PgdA/CDA1 family)